MTSILKADDIASSIIAAAESARESSVAVMVALAPVIGPFPAAAITGMHAVTIFGNAPLGWAAAFGVVAGIEATGIGLSATSAALKRHDLIDHAKEIDITYWLYAGLVVVANVAMSVQTHGIENISAVIFETALAVLPIPVQKMVSKIAEIGAVERAAANNEAKGAAKKAQEFEDGERAKDNQLERDLKIMRERAALRVQKVQESSEKVQESSEKFPKDIRKLTKDQKVYLASLPLGEIAAKVGITFKSEQNWRKAFEKEGIQ